MDQYGLSVIFRYGHACVGASLFSAPQTRDFISSIVFDAFYGRLTRVVVVRRSRCRPMGIEGLVSRNVSNASRVDVKFRASAAQGLVVRHVFAYLPAV